MQDIGELVDGIRGTLPFRTLEDMMVSYDGFGLTTASNLQRAIFRVIEGRPLDGLWEYEEVQRAFGGTPPPVERPKTVVVMSGIRSGKTFSVGGAAVHMTQTCDLTSPQMRLMLKPGDIPRVSIVSLSTDTAKPAYLHIVNSILASKRLSRLLLNEPTADTVILKHPSGRPIEIKVVAGSRAGGSLVARWSVGVIFDEAPRMVGEEEGVVNLDHALAATELRMLPGCPIFLIGSPWQPYGPVYDKYIEYFGNPHDGVVVIKAPAPDMNPIWWTPERVAAERLRKPDEARTDIDAEFRDPETSLFSTVSVERSTRDTPVTLEPDRRNEYSAGMDPATRGNSWTLTLGTKDENEKLRVAFVTQWTGNKSDPLSPRQTMREIAEYLRPYGVTSIATDQWCSDAIKDFGHEVGLSIYEDTVTPQESVRRYSALSQRLDAGLIELPPNAQFLSDLKSVRKRANRGGVSIVLPKTQDGRHADYAPSFMLAFSRWIDAPLPEAPEDENYDEEDEDIWDDVEVDEDEEYSPEGVLQGDGW